MLFYRNPLIGQRGTPPAGTFPQGDVMMSRSSPEFALPGGGFGARFMRPQIDLYRAQAPMPQMPVAQPPRVSRSSDQRRPWETSAALPFMGLASLGRAIRPLNGMNYDWFG